jgi:hypothetical protein
MDVTQVTREAAVTEARLAIWDDDQGFIPFGDTFPIEAVIEVAEVAGYPGYFKLPVGTYAGTLIPHSGDAYTITEAHCGYCHQPMLVSEYENAGHHLVCEQAACQYEYWNEQDADR